MTVTPPANAPQPWWHRILAVLTVPLLAVGVATILPPTQARAATPSTAAADGLSAEGAPAKAAQQRPATLSGGVDHTISYDHYSLKIDGQRTYIWSGEFHYFRLPSPSLWRDVLQKMKAAGFNAVSIYFDWAYHSPAPGVYDFSGVRDVDKLLDIANQVGLYVIARPGPYINAEVDGGGFPAWLDTKPGKDRSADASYLKYADQWLSKIDTILARHQMTNGTGPIIAYQVENEYYDGSPAGRDYMEHLEKKARADGITVPLTGNHGGIFNSGRAALDIDGIDSYPQGFNCSNPTQWRGVDNISRDHPDDRPLYTAEYQGGAFDPWGGPGYAKCRQLTGPDFENVFYKNNIAVGATMQNFYMTYGGTNWGNQAEPAVYSSYDYGAAITEGRQLTAKYQQDKLIGYFTQSVAPLTKTDPVAVGAPTNSDVVDTARINPDTHSQFQVLRHRDSTSTAKDSTHISIDLAASAGYTYDDADTTDLHYSGDWSHVGSEVNYTHGEYDQTESFSDTAGDSVTIPFTGRAIRWIASTAANHGIANVYVDNSQVTTVDGYSPNAVNQQLQYQVSGLSDGKHTLKIEVTGQKNAKSQGTFVSVDAIDLPTGSARVYPSVPQKSSTSIDLDGRESKIILANYQLGKSQLQYSTSELLTNQTIDGRDIAVLYGDKGTDGETVLNYANKPTVNVLAGTVQTTWDADTGDLRLDYAHAGLARVLITDGGVRPLLLLIGTAAQAEKFWLADTSSGPVLVYGSDLLRTATVADGSLALAGDSASAQPIEVFAAPADGYTWDGHTLQTKQTSSGSVKASIAGPQQVQLPALAHWKHKQGSPEAQPGFDDSSWQVADKMTSNSTTAPVTLPVLFQDDYGFHYGDVWYRGHFTASKAATGIKLSAITGTAGNYEVWLNGTYLGHSDDAAHTFTFPAGVLRGDGDNEVSVLVDTSGHNEDYSEQDSNKEARGLTGASIAGAPLSTITWRIQGARGGEDPIDPVRGPMNTGGLYGERAGWTLQGYPDDKWESVTLPTTDATPGVSWYRTQVNLSLPKGQDSSVALKISDDASRAYRALIYVNGWQLGKYINNIGPQHVFPIPSGILRTDGDNTIAIAVTNEDAKTGGLGDVTLVNLGSPASSLHVDPVTSPDYDHEKYSLPAPHRATLTVNAPGALSAEGAATVSASFDTLDDAPAARGVDLKLSLPDGWNVEPRSPTSADNPVRAGHPFTATWKVTALSTLPTISQLTVTADYRQGGSRQTLSTVRNIRMLPAPPTSDVQVSALPFLSASNGWGPVERNESNGEKAADDGQTITINGAQYSHGLGTNSPSDIALYLGEHCTRFQADVGVDDETDGAGSVTFSVIADGKTIVTTPVIDGHQDAVHLDLDVTGTKVLNLAVGDGGDNNGNDHADWANARLACAGVPAAANGLRVKWVKPGSARVAYFPQSTGGAKVLKYTLTAVDQSRGANHGSTVTASSRSNATTLTGLIDGDVYEVTETTTSTVGTSEPSKALTLRTVPAPANGLSVKWVKPGKARVAYFPQRHAGAKVDHYTLTAVDRSPGKHHGSTVTASSRSNATTLTGLIDGDVYQVTETTTSTVGTSKPSKALTLRTVPAPANGLSVKWVKPGKARVAYFPQRHAGAKVDHYTLTALDQSPGKHHGSTVTASSRSNATTLTGLIDGDVYQVTETTTSTVGTSAPSKALSVHAGEAVPIPYTPPRRQDTPYTVDTVAPTPGEIDPIRRVDITTSKDDYYLQYRIPALIVTNDGTIVTSYDGRHTVADLPSHIDNLVRISHDGGKTWSDQIVARSGPYPDGFGDPSLGYDPATNRIFRFYTGSISTGFFSGHAGTSATDPDVLQNWVSYSDDDGKTWTNHNITAQTKDPSWLGMFASSGTATYVATGPYKGRLVDMYPVRTPKGTGVVAVWTDDNGETWHHGAPTAIGAGNETKTVELSNGDLMLSLRATGHRLSAISTDGGATWGPLQTEQQLVDPNDNGSILRVYPDAAASDPKSDILLETNNGDPAIRRDTVVRMSCDDGQTWPISKMLQPGSSGYSTAVMVPGTTTVDALYERSGYKHITFESFTLSALDGACAPLSLPKAVSLSAGKSTTIPVTITNQEQATLPAGELSIASAPYVAGTANTPTIPAGAAATVNVSVSAGAQAPAATEPITVTYTADGRSSALDTQAVIARGTTHSQTAIDDTATHVLDGKTLIDKTEDLPELKGAAGGSISVTFNTTSKAVVQTLFGFTEKALHNYDMLLTLNSGTPYFEIRAGSNSYITRFTSSTDVADGHNHTLTLAAADGKTTLSLDGTVIGTQDGQHFFGELPDADSVTIGGGTFQPSGGGAPANQWFFTGTISHVLVTTLQTQAPAPTPEPAVRIVPDLDVYHYTAAHGLGVGDQGSYLVRVTNVGNVPLTRLSSSGNIPLAGGCPTGTLNPAQSIICSGAHTFMQADVAARSFTPRVSVTATAAGEPFTATQTGVTVPLPAPYVLPVAPEATATPVAGCAPDTIRPVNAIANTEESFANHGAQNTPATNAIDGNPDTFWSSGWSVGVQEFPNWIIVDLGRSTDVCGITYTPRQGNTNGNIGEWRAYVSNNPNDFGAPVAGGTLVSGNATQTAYFPHPAKGRYLKLAAYSDIGANHTQTTTIAELSAHGKR